MQEFFDDQNAPPSIDDRVVLQEVFKCLVDILKKEKEPYGDAFDNYSHQLRLRLQSDDPNFLTKLLAGYDVLMLGLKK